MQNRSLHPLPMRSGTNPIPAGVEEQNTQQGAAPTVPTFAETEQKKVAAAKRPRRKPKKAAIPAENSDSPSKNPQASSKACDKRENKSEIDQQVETSPRIAAQKTRPVKPAEEKTSAWIVALQEQIQKMGAKDYQEMRAKDYEEMRARDYQEMKAKDYQEMRAKDYQVVEKASQQLSSTVPLPLLNYLFDLNAAITQLTGEKIYVCGSIVYKNGLGFCSIVASQDKLAEQFTSIASSDIDYYVKSEVGANRDIITAENIVTRTVLNVEGKPTLPSYKTNFNNEFTNYTLDFPLADKGSRITIDTTIRYPNYKETSFVLIPLTHIKGTFGAKPNAEFPSIKFDENRYFIIEDKKLCKDAINTRTYDIALPSPDHLHTTTVTKMLYRAFHFMLRMKTRYDGEPLLKPGQNALRLLDEKAEWAHYYFAYHLFSDSERLLKNCHDDLEKIIASKLFLRDELTPILKAFFKVALLKKLSEKDPELLAAVRKNLADGVEIAKLCANDRTMSASEHMVTIFRSFFADPTASPKRMVTVKDFLLSNLEKSGGYSLSQDKWLKELKRLFAPKEDPMKNLIKRRYSGELFVRSKYNETVDVCQDFLEQLSSPLLPSDQVKKRAEKMATNLQDYYQFFPFPRQKPIEEVLPYLASDISWLIRKGHFIMNIYLSEVRFHYNKLWLNSGVKEDILHQQIPNLYEDNVVLLHQLLWQAIDGERERYRLQPLVEKMCELILTWRSDTSHLPRGAANRAAKALLKYYNELGNNTHANLYELIDTLATDLTLLARHDFRASDYVAYLQRKYASCPVHLPLSAFYPLASPVGSEDSFSKETTPSSSPSHQGVIDLLASASSSPTSVSSDEKTTSPRSTFSRSSSSDGSRSQSDSHQSVIDLLVSASSTASVSSDEKTTSPPSTFSRSSSRHWSRSQSDSRQSAIDFLLSTLQPGFHQDVGDGFRSRPSSLPPPIDSNKTRVDLRQSTQSAPLASYRSPRQSASPQGVSGVSVSKLSLQTPPTGSDKKARDRRQNGPSVLPGSAWSKQPLIFSQGVSSAFASTPSSPMSVDSEGGSCDLPQRAPSVASSRQSPCSPQSAALSKAKSYRRVARPSFYEKEAGSRQERPCSAPLPNKSPLPFRKPK